MNKEDINIVYTSILREKHTILSEYTECSGNFSQIMLHIMKEIIFIYEGQNIKIQCNKNEKMKDIIEI